MLNAASGSSSSKSLLLEYTSLLSDAILRQRARTAERSAQIETELANRVKSEFISNMSHELRTPLNTVIGFSKILSEHGRRTLTDQEIVEYANLIFSAAGHLLAVINDILDLSKIQSGKYSLDARETNIDDVVQFSIAAFRKPAADAKLDLIPSIAIDLPPVRGDATKLRQVFANLISNAVKFTPQGGRINVEAIRVNNGGVAIFVRDTGVGMTPDEVAIALTPFGQVDARRTRWREGTGLGLTIAKALVELHGGKLDIRSVKNEGTEVAVMLPPAATTEPAFYNDARATPAGNGHSMTKE